MANEINMHSLVLMHYSITLADGNIIESSFEDEPVVITMGKGDITEGMELAIFGLKEGDSQTLSLTAEQGFGIRKEDNIHNMPRADFPSDLPLKQGLSYSFESPQGEEIPGTVIDIKDDTVRVDFNHPLAGQEVVFHVKILEVNNAHKHIP